MNRDRWTARYRAWAQRRGMSPATLRSDLVWMGLYLDFLEQQGIDDPTRADRSAIQLYEAHLMTLRSRYDRPYKISTRHQILGWVKTFYGFLLEEGHVLLDPSARLRLPRVGEHLPRSVLSPAQMRRLLQAPDVDDPWGLRDRAILEVLYGTGLRYGELARLEVGDLDVVEKVLWVRQGKGRRDRVLPLGRWAAHWLARYLEASRDLRARQGTHRVFLTHKGGILSGTQLNQTLRRYAKQAGIEKHLTVHAIRHTFATLLVRGGADVRKVQALLGHTRLTSTQIYTHLALEDLREVQARCHPREKKPQESEPEENGPR